ncbi:MAG: hypothetical protein IIA00_02600 [Proteobacteria bacterium]|nr:hypothetical protein [Pseudomonadota bacterium]
MFIGILVQPIPLPSFFIFHGRRPGRRGEAARGPARHGTEAGERSISGDDQGEALRARHRFSLQLHPIAAAGPRAHS